jgi:hypothetical protein
MDVADTAPPSTYVRPLIVTGTNQPGIAHEAMTALAIGATGTPGRPKTTRLPSS